MCWSEKSSLTTFLIGTIVSLFLIVRNKAYDRLFGIFFVWIIFMQFLEYLMWRDINCTTNLNNIASQMAWFQNLSQPLIGGILLIVYVYVGRTLKDKNKNSPIPLVLFTILLIAYAWLFLWWIFDKKPYKTTFCTQPCKTNCGGRHLQWAWTKNYGSLIWIGYFIMFAVIIVASLRNKAGLILSAYLLITCVIAAIFLPFSKALGSWWCVFAIGGPVVKLLIPTSIFDQPLLY